MHAQARRSRLLARHKAREAVASGSRTADTGSMANQHDEFGDIGRKVEEKFNQAMPRVEEEVKRVIAYLNDEVVPGVRENSARVLKAAADQLNKLAERLDRVAGGR